MRARDPIPLPPALPKLLFGQIKLNTAWRTIWWVSFVRHSVTPLWKILPGFPDGEERVTVVVRKNFTIKKLLYRKISTLRKETYAWKNRNLLPLHKPQLLLHFSFILSPELHWFDKAHDGHLGSESVQSVNVSKQPGVFNLAEKLNYLTSNQSLNIIMSFHEWLHFSRGSGI